MSLGFSNYMQSTILGGIPKSLKNLKFTNSVEEKQEISYIKTKIQ